MGDQDALERELAGYELRVAVARERGDKAAEQAAQARVDGVLALLGRRRARRASRDTETASAQPPEVR